MCTTSDNSAQTLRWQTFLRSDTVRHVCRLSSALVVQTNCGISCLAGCSQTILQVHEVDVKVPALASLM